MPWFSSNTSFSLLIASLIHKLSINLLLNLLILGIFLRYFHYWFLIYFHSGLIHSCFLLPNLLFPRTLWFLTCDFTQIRCPPYSSSKLCQMKCVAFSFVPAKPFSCTHSRVLVTLGCNYEFLSFSSLLGSSPQVQQWNFMHVCLHRAHWSFMSEWMNEWSQWQSHLILSPRKLISPAPRMTQLLKSKRRCEYQERDGRHK